MTNEDMIDDDSLLEGVKKKAAIKGRLSQFMIFVNGLILSVTAFVTLMIFMDQMHDSKTKNINSVVLADIASEFQDLTNILFLIPAYEAKLNNRNFFENEVKSKFNYLYGLSKVGERWSANVLLSNKGVDNDKISETISNIKNYGVSPDQNIRFVPNDQENGILAVMSNEKDSYYIGFIKPEVFDDVLSNNTDVYRIRIFDDWSGDKLLFVENREAARVTNHNDLSRVIDKINVSGMTYSVTTEILKDPFYTFISKLPYLLLLFGGTLTIVGTLYVRNNQKQGHQLEIMNMALEDKNKILESKIQESKDLYNKILDKEDEYQAVLNAVQDVLFEIDKAGQIQFMNDAWVNISKTSVDDVLYRDLFSFFNEDDEIKLRKSFASFLEHKTSLSDNAKIKMANGSLKAVEIVFSVLRENRDGQIRIVGTIHDAEEKQRAKQALSEVEKKYKTIVENAAGGIYQITPKGQIMSGNPALARLLGYNDIDQLVEDDFNMNAAFTSTGNRHEYEVSLHKDGFIRNHEAELRQSNGQIIWVNENARAVKDIDGSILYYEGSIEDITQRKNAETDIIQEKLNSDLASRAKSEFLTNMSHELRTPLNAIIGFSEIIKGEALGEIENKNYVDYAKDIYDSGGRLLNVINEILGISKIEAGNRQLSESIVNIGSVIDTCKNLLASKIETHALDVNSTIDDETPSVVAEELAFKQIFMNLLSNAIKFTPPNGKITITSEYEQGGDLRLSVTDTGVGMDDSDIPKALSPFGQLDNSLSRSGSGTGLGLTLVSSLVHLHGGQLEMISQKGIGTAVTVIMPAKRVAVQKKKNGGASSGNIASLRDYKNK